MKTQRDSALRISVLLAAPLIVCGSPAFAEDESDLTELTTPDSSVSLGAGLQNNDRPQFGKYDGRRDDGATLLLDANINKRDDATGTWNQIKFKNTGLDNREVEFGHSRQGDYGVSFDYSRISSESPLTFNTGLSGIGTELQKVNVIAPGTSPQDVQLGMHRDRYTLGLNKIFPGVFEGSLDLNIKFRQEEKDGQRNFSAYMTRATTPPAAVNQANFLVEPINSTTRQLDVFVDYLGKDLQLQAGYYGSWYDNANSLITAQNGTNTIYVSLPPDNQAHQFYINGAYAITPTTKTTMRLSRTTATQNDNSLLTAIPAASLWPGYNGTNAKVVTTEGQFGITTKPTKDLSLLANASYQDRDDRTPLEAYNNQPTPDETTPHSFKTENLKLEATYRVQPGFKLMAGAYLDIRERSIPFRNENTIPAVPTNAGVNWTIPTTTNEREVPYRYRTNELTYKGQVTKTLFDELNASITYAHSKRDGSRFFWADQQNLINPMYTADRDRDKLGLKLEWTPMESLSFQAQFAESRDDYGSNGLNGNYTAPNGQTLGGTGLTDGRARLFSLDADLKLNDNWQITAWYSYDQNRATQYAFQNTFGPTPNRKINLSDTGDSFGLSIKGTVTQRLSLGADLEWNRSVGRYVQSNVKDVAGTLNEDLPSITNKSIRFALNGIYQLDKKSSLRMDLVYDQWKTNDWSWMMWNSTSTALVPVAYASDGTSASVSSRQSAVFAAVRYVYKF